MLKEESRELRKAAENERRALADTFPSTRTIGRIRADEWTPMTEEEKAKYRRFTWPTSIDRGDLPPEASQAALEFMRECLAILGMAWAGPSIRVMQTFWKVTQAVPDAPFDTRLGATSILLVAESMGNEEWTTAVQWFLALQPWTSDDAADKYEVAIAGQGVPMIPIGVTRYNSALLEAEDSEFLTVVNLARQRQEEGKNQ